jgi:hypothetical protein
MLSASSDAYPGTSASDVALSVLSFAPPCPHEHVDYRHIKPLLDFTSRGIMLVV